MPDGELHDGADPTCRVVETLLDFRELSLELLCEAAEDLGGRFGLFESFVGSMRDALDVLMVQIVGGGEIEVELSDGADLLDEEVGAAVIGSHVGDIC